MARDVTKDNSQIPYMHISLDQQFSLILYE